MSCSSFESFCDITRILVDIASESPTSERIHVLRTILKIVVRSENVFDFSNKSTVKLLNVIKEKCDEAVRHDRKLAEYSEQIGNMLGYRGPMTRSRTRSNP